MNHKGATHLTLNKRFAIERMLKVGDTKEKIAEAVGVCVRTIYNEIQRGLCVQQTTDYEFVEVYCADVAENRYQEYLRAKGPDLKIGSDFALAARLEELMMQEHYSSGAVLAELRNNGEKFDTELCGVHRI